MRRLPPLLVALAALAACRSPKPCTRALCLEKLDGTYEASAWSGTVASTPSEPATPIPPFSQVTMKHGTAVFRHGKTTLKAEEGTSFAFTVSTRAATARVDVSSGVVTATPAKGAPVTVTTGGSYVFPKP